MMRSVFVSSLAALPKNASVTKARMLEKDRVCIMFMYFIDIIISKINSFKYIHIII